MAVTNTGNQTVQGDLLVEGGATFQGSLEGIARGDLDITTGREHEVPLERWQPWDDGVDVLPTAPVIANDDLGRVPGTWGTDGASLQTADQKTTTNTKYAATTLVLPPDYVAGSPVSLEVRCGMKTTASDGSATLDLEVYKLVDGLISGSELVNAAAQSINSTTLATKSFVIAPATLNPGDKIGLRLSLAIADTASGTAVIGIVTKTMIKFNER